MTSNSDDMTMQSEIFVTIMVVMILLFVASILNIRTAINAKKEAEEAIHKIREKEQPPLIILDEAKNYSFKTGVGEISKHFQNKLQNDIIPYLEKMSEEYDCDVIEVYGYTDGQAYRYRYSKNNSMDKALLSYLENNQFPELSASSNLELGMLRAAAIVYILKKSQENGHLKNIKIIRPYSGGQLILPNGTIASVYDNQPKAQRRRIELRLSRSRDLHK